MTFIAELRGRVDLLGGFAELDVSCGSLPVSVAGLSDESVREALGVAAGLAREVATLHAVLAGVVAQRSARDAGHGGFSAVGGFRTPVQMIQTVAGVSKGEAIRAVRVGEALLEGGGGDAPGHSGDAGDPGDLAVGAAGRMPWHQPLGEALLAGRITPAQHDAIRMGLGSPPVIAGHDSVEVEAAWGAAASELIEQSGVLTVEELGVHARTLRDMLDPVTAEERAAARFEKRSFRLRTDADGVHHAHITFDDEMALWVKAVQDSALRARRGGPRFVAQGEKDAAKALTDDTRSNDQVAYDLFTDLLRTGSLARAEDVFGSRQPGVRMVVMKDTLGPRDAFGRMLAVGHAEDGGQAVAGSLLDRALCLGGAVQVTVDAHGNPLDLGREQRLYSSAQRLVMAVRDGGCRWPGCDRPPSYCEAHHIDQWSADTGRTDIDRGILLCRFHHMNLHHAGWTITRQGKDSFRLHPPPDRSGNAESGSGGSRSVHPASAGIVLESKSPLRWAWDPPPDRVHWRTAA